MKLNAYIKSFPRNQRQEVRQSIADACGVCLSAVKHWESGIRGVPAKHFPAIVEACNHKITYDDLIIRKSA